MMNDLFFMLTGALILLGGTYFWGLKNPQYKTFKGFDGKLKKVNMVTVWCFITALILMPFWMAIAYAMAIQ